MTISENISDKRKRGRPPLMTPEMEKALGAIYGPSTRRTSLNRYYMFRALDVLDLNKHTAPDHPCSCLYQPAVEIVKTTILTELGRVADDLVLHALAERICHDKMTTQQAIVFIRRVRFGGQAALPTSKEAGIEALAEQIIETINRYLKHYTIPAEDIRPAPAVSCHNTVGLAHPGDYRDCPYARMIHQSA